MSFTVLSMLLNNTSGASSRLPPPTWSGPDPSIVQVQTILFGSLASALFAALLASLGKQWLNFYVEGSFIDRNRHRELKMRGMITWRFKFIMECLPLIIHTSLLLLGYALAQYLWGLSHTVSSAITGFTASGVALYIFIIFAGTFSKTCPFQTPISVVIRETRERYREDVTEAFKGILTFFKTAQPQAGLVIHRGQTTTPPNPPDADDQDDRARVRSELSCISTMFKMSKAPDSVTAIMAYIPEIVWDGRVKSVPLLQVYRTLRESLRRSADGGIFPRQGVRDQAFWSAKALLHLYLQRRCIHRADTNLLNQVKLADHQNNLLGRHGFDKDFDLASTFYLVDSTFANSTSGNQPEIPWSGLQLSESHHCWLSHILRYRAWDILSARKTLTEDVRGFVRESLGRQLPGRVIANCLSIVSMVAGRVPQPRDLLKDQRLGFFDVFRTDANTLPSHQITELINGTFDQLDLVFGQGTLGDMSSAVDALSLVIQLRDPRVCARSYALFRIIMRHVDHNNELWLPARLSIQGAYTAAKPDVPQVGDPKQLLQFLDHHMERRDSIGDEPIRHVFSALFLASNEETHRGLATYTFSNQLFIKTLTAALGKKDFKPLRKSAILLLAELDKYLFATKDAFTDPSDPGRASDFVHAWSSAVHEFLGDPTHQVEMATVKVLLAIVNLPSLRVCLPVERWNWIQHFPYILNENPPSLQRCLENTSIIPFLKQTVSNWSQSPWLAMLWMMHHHLSEGVQEDLEKETREIVSKGSYLRLDPFLAFFDVSLKSLQTQIDRLDPLDRTASDLWTKRESLVRARGRLLSIRKEGERKFTF